jgi:hypothetical protein
MRAEFKLNGKESYEAITTSIKMKAFNFGICKKRWLPPKKFIFALQMSDKHLALLLAQKTVSRPHLL